MASWLVRSSTDRAVRVRALAGDTVLCPWARHFTLTVPLSTQEYKWVPANCWGVTCDGLASRPGGVEIFLAASCYGNWDKLRPDEPVGSIRLHYLYIKPSQPHTTFQGNMFQLYEDMIDHCSYIHSTRTIDHCSYIHSTRSPLTGVAISYITPVGKPFPVFFLK